MRADATDVVTGGLGTIPVEYMGKKYYATSNGKLAIDKALLKFPVLGDVLRKSAVSRFTRTLGTLLVATRAVTRGRENSRRLTVLFDAAVRAQTLSERRLVMGALVDDARELLRVLNDLGFTGRVEGVNAVDAFWGSLPGLFYPNLRRPVLHTGNLGQLFPSTALWAGEEHNPSPLLPLRSPPLMIAETAGSTPFRLNTDTDTSGNALVLGPPGAGKSAFLNLHRLQVLRYAGAQTAFFDIGHSAWLPAVATGARHHDIGGEGAKLQPLRDVHHNAEALWGREWVEGLVEVQGHVCDAADRVKLERAVRLLAEQAEHGNTSGKVVIFTESLHGAVFADAPSSSAMIAARCAHSTEWASTFWP